MLYDLIQFKYASLHEIKKVAALHWEYMFPMLKVGAIQSVSSPGMGRWNLKKCITKAGEPKGRFHV